MQEYITTEEAAKILGLHPGTLKNWRSTGEGPKYLKPSPGTIRYRLSDLDEWMTANERPLTEDEEESL